MTDQELEELYKKCAQCKHCHSSEEDDYIECDVVKCQFEPYKSKMKGRRK